MIRFLFIFITSSYATSFSPQPFPTEVQDAPVIVRGRVGMSYSDWNKDTEEGSKRLYTYYELQLMEVFKGKVSGSSPGTSPATSLTMREMGGEKDGIGLHIPGTAEFSKGEETVVFLKEKNAEGSYDVLGMMMGKYNIQTDETGKEYLRGPGLSEETHKWTLDAMQQLIRDQAAPSDSNSPSHPDHSDRGPTARALPPQPRPEESQTPPALQLQTSPSEKSPSPPLFLTYLGVGIGLLSAIGLLAAALRKK